MFPPRPGQSAAPPGILVFSPHGARFFKIEERRAALRSAAAVRGTNLAPRQIQFLQSTMDSQAHPLFSVLDLCPVTQGSSASESFRNTLDLARHAERWGYHRYWLAEHHNFPGVASAATAVVIGHVAGGQRNG